MTLASMINLDEDALICDLAETYNIYDYRSHPVKLVATLSAGLRGDSRIKMLAADMPAPQDTILLAIIADCVGALNYKFSEDSAKGKNKPISLVDALYGGVKKKSTGVVGFDTKEEFEATLTRIRRG